jgi:hypothetical protein
LLGTARHQALRADRRNHSPDPEGTDLKQFVDGIEVMVHEYNTQHRHRGLPKRADGKHMTPMEAFEARVDPSSWSCSTLSCARCSCLA